MSAPGLQTAEPGIERMHSGLQSVGDVQPIITAGPADENIGKVLAAGAVVGGLSDAQFRQLMSRMPAPVAPAPVSGLGNPGPLGLGAFALTTFVLSVFNTGAFIDPRLEATVLPLALWFGGIAQFAAGMWEFRYGNTFGATAFTSYGAFWLSFATYVEFIAPRLAAGGLPVGHATGLFLFAWLLWTVGLTGAAFRVSVTVFTIFFLLSFAFLLLTIGALAPSVGCTKAGGWLGLVTAGAAWYGSFGVLINTTFGARIFHIGAYTLPKTGGGAVEQ